MVAAMETPRSWLPFTHQWSMKKSYLLDSSQMMNASRMHQSFGVHDSHGEVKAERRYRTSIWGYGFSRLVGTVVVRVVSIVLLVLSFLIPRRGRPVRVKASHELHALAYLDALRGYLALIIFTGHTMPQHWKWIPEPIMATPGIQFLFRGGFTSLDIFFWISGYAVTYRIVGFMQAKRMDRVLDTLASSIFRRYFRLFLPIMPVTFVTMVAVYTGIAIPPENKAKVITGNPVWWWIKDSAHVLNPFTHIIGHWDGQTGSALLDPFWSLSAEFRSSMIIFTFCAGTCKMTSKNRRLLIWLCIPPFICWEAQWAAMAFLGMWFAECRQQKVGEQQEHKSLVTAQVSHVESDTSKQSISTFVDGEFSEKRERLGQESRFGTLPTLSELRGKDLSRFRQPILIIMFLYAFVFLKDPYKSNEKKYFPHNILNMTTPKHWHVQMKMHLHLVIGAFLMLYPLDQLPVLQRPLRTPFSQYLGELSFGIYAVHFTVRWIVWEPRYVEWQKKRHGNERFDHFRVLFPGYLFMAIVVLWAAELFRRLDMQVVKFCKKLEDWFFE